MNRDASPPVRTVTRRGAGSAALLLVASPLICCAGRAPGPPLTVGLFVDLGAVRLAPSTTRLETAGYAQPGVGAAIYVLDPDQGERLETPYRKKAGDGRWFVLGEAEIDIRMTGAVGDGKTDDTTAIQAAIDFGRRILVPATSVHYRITSPLVLRSGRTIRGVGAASGIRQSGSQINAGVLWGDRVSEVVVSGLKLMPGARPDALLHGHALHLRDSRDLKVEAVQVTGHSRGGVTLQNCARAKVTGCAIADSTVDPQVDDHTRSGYDILIVDGGRSITISRNHCRNGAGIGIAVQALASAGPFQFADIEVDGNIVDGQGCYGILLYRSKADIFSGMRVTGNRVENISGQVRQAEHGRVFGAGIYVQGVDGTVVAGNQVRATNLATEIESLAPAGIGVANTADAQVVNNVVEGCRWYGVSAFDPNREGRSDGRTQIIGNTILAAGRSGIYAKSMPGAEIVRNTISDCGEHGVLVQDPVGRQGLVEVRENHVFHNGGQGVFFLAGDGEVTDNDVRENAGAGIGLANGQFSLRRNVVTGNAGVGVSAGEQVDISLSENTVRNNHAGDMSIQGTRRGT